MKIRLGREWVALDESWRYACGGYTGRDQAVVRAHIEELLKIGVAAPPATPTFYRVPPYLLTMDNRVWALHDETSGEIEPVYLITSPDEVYVSLGSDHTDRRLESHDVDASKWMGQKVLASQAWPWEDVRATWDAATLTSWVELADSPHAVLYQEGSPAQLLGPDYWVDYLQSRYGDARHWVVFGGTIPHRDLAGSHQSFSGELSTPGPHGAQSLRIRYRIDVIDKAKPGN